MHFLNVLLAISSLSIAAHAATVNVYPSIVQLIAEDSPTQVFKNTAGSTNEFFVAAVSANEGRGPAESTLTLPSLHLLSQPQRIPFLNTLPNPSNHPAPPLDWIYNSRVFTLLSFTSIPPFASNCELRVSLPPEHLFWQSATTLTGGLTTPTLWILPLRLDPSTSSTWTWNAFKAAEPSDVAVQYPVINGADFNDGNIEVIVPMEACPGVSRPTGGEVGYAFSIANDIPWASASVFMNMEYGGPDLFGVYLQYST